MSAENMRIETNIVIPTIMQLLNCVSQECKPLKSLKFSEKFVIFITIIVPSEF